MRALGVVVVVVAVSGCGGSSDSPATCGMSAAFSGGLAGSTSGDPACLTSFAGGANIDGSFIFLDGAVESVELSIDEIDMGETGPSFPTDVTVNARAGGSWSGTCTAAVTEHTLEGPRELGDAYRARGTVTCASPLASDGADPAITVASMSFVMTSTWP